MPASSESTEARERLTRRDFFHDLANELRPLLPESLRDFQSSTTRNLLKLYYGERRLHFEVWANARDGHIEVGLHFEDGPESTEYLLAYFNRHIVELKHELGPELELERWTNSWGHVYQLLPYQPLTDRLTHQVAARLARLVTVLQPVLEEAEPRARRRPGVLSSRTPPSAPFAPTRGRGSDRKGHGRQWQ